MGLELDTLKVNSGINVILNNTTGVIVDMGYELDHFKHELEHTFGIKPEEIPSYFSFEELEEFFLDNDIDFEYVELEAIYDGWEFKRRYENAY